MRFLQSLIFVFIFASVGCQTTKKDLSYWLQKAEAAEQRNDIELLRQATANVTAAWRENPDTSVPGYELTVQSSPPEAHKPKYFDHFLAAEKVNLAGLKKRQERAGLGAPLVAVKEYSEENPESKYYSDAGLCHSMTGVLTFHSEKERGAIEGKSQRVTLDLYDPSMTTSVDGKPLAADFSAALCETMGKPRLLRREGLMGLLAAGNPKLTGGFQLTQPYDPKKTPLIFVHGLMSSQLAWRNLVNELFAEPEILERYQIWFYHYPTGNPVLVSAYKFRQNLDELRHYLDADGRDPAMQKTVVIAHSMGGLLTKTLITDTGEKMWNNTFTVSANELDMSIVERQNLQGGLHWKARKDVKKVIYIAVPHRGSKIATSFIGRFAQKIMRIPETIVNLSNDILSLDASALSDEAREAVDDLRLNSIRNLSPDDPTLLTLDSLPKAPWVKRYSIIGNRGKPGPLEESSDGVVPYTSSHVEGVESEVIVPGNHGAYKTEEAVQEIIRVLKLP